MPYKFFSSSRNAWQAMFGAIESAHESVYLEMYIFEDNIADFDFLQLLQDKARKGVRVRVILDYFGSFNLNKTSIAELRSSGAEVFFISYFFHRTHRKVLVVDEHIAFIGGANFHRSAFAWNDLVVQVEGKLVASILSSFAKVYRECGGRDLLVLVRNKRVILKKTRAWLVEHFPVRKRGRLKKIYKEHIRRAEKSIVLVTPYFMPKRWFLAILHQAVLRGVQVDILVPANIDHYFMERVNYFFMFKLAKLGVSFYLQPKMNHAKVMIIDGKEGMVGSNNLDFLSFELNSEVGIFFQNRDAVGRLLEIIKEWKKDATLFDFKTYKPKLLDYFLSPLFSIFAKIF